jgi:hypothetical protein
MFLFFFVQRALVIGLYLFFVALHIAFCCVLCKCFNAHDDSEINWNILYEIWQTETYNPKELTVSKFKILNFENLESCTGDLSDYVRTIDSVEQDAAVQY